MTVDCIEIPKLGIKQGIQDWLDAHSSTTIKQIVLEGNWVYFFYE